MQTVGQKDEQMSTWQDIIRITDYNVPYWHKIVDGPRKVNSIFYPTVGDDGKAKTVVITTKTWETSVFSRLAEIDRKIQKHRLSDRLGSTAEYHEAARKVKSHLDPKSSFHCLVIDKKDSIPVIKRAEYKYTVYDKIVKIEDERYVDENGARNEAKLRYGLLVMLWLEIKRVEKSESKLPQQYNTDYTVKVMEKLCAKWEGRVPSVLLNKPQKLDLEKQSIIVVTPTKEIPIPVVELGALTQEEFNAVANCEYNLVDLVRPMTADEALEKLQTYPLKLDATDEKGQFILPDWKEIKELITKERIDLPIAVDDTPKGLPTRSENSKPQKIDEELPEWITDEPKKPTQEQNKSNSILDELFEKKEKNGFESLV